MIPTPELTEARTLLLGAGTWHEFRRSLEERGLDKALHPDDMLDLMAAWNSRRAGALTDAALTQELEFWAAGGTFDQHLEGWQAVSPAALVAEAEQRRWFTRRMASGAVVNPPVGKPLMIRSLDVMVAPPA